MPKDIIFEITKDHLKTGLRGIPVGYCPTSYLDENKGLFYAGKSLQEIVDWDPLKVIYLLLYSIEPPEKELNDFKEKIKKESFLPQEILDLANFEYIKKLDPINLLSLTITMLKNLDKHTSLEDSCLSLIAKIPLLCSFIINPDSIPKNNQDYLKELIPSCNLSDSFYEYLKIHNILYYDAGGGSPETFTAKIMASSGVDLYSSVAGGIKALLGDTNAKSCLHAFNLLKTIYETSENDFSSTQIEETLKNELKENKTIYGFGHRIFKIEDPRATILFDIAKQNFAEHPLIILSFYLRSIGKKVLSENSNIVNPNMNVTGISGAFLHSAGYQNPNHYPLFIALARATGMTIQVFHEIKKKKKSPIHPLYIYRANF